MQRIKRADIEGALIDWLPVALSGLDWVGVEVADELTTAESVAVFRTGGPMRDLVTDLAQITIESCSSTKSRSADLAAEIDSLVRQLEGETIGSCTIQEVSAAGLAFFPTEDRPTRYSQTFSIAVTAEILG